MIEVGVLGATGMVGQQFIARLGRHPWFKVTWLAASERSEGKRYADAAPWRLATPMPDACAGLTVNACEPGRGPKVVFSALDAKAADQLEHVFAAAGHIVLSNARTFRMDPLVPLLIPEVNPDHLSLLDYQRRAKGWSGSLVTNPNCATIVVAMVLGALRQFQPRRVMVTTLQALSGAGYPGVASLDAIANIIPYIGGGEEEKIETESLKLLGRFENGVVHDADFVVSAQTTRVPVPDGHTAMMSIELETKPSVEEVSAALDAFTAEPQQRLLPSAPPKPIVLHTADNRPQPRLDVAFGGGMPVHCGRVRRCPLLGYKLVAMGHNVVRGAAGAALLNAELMVARGLTVAAETGAPLTTPRR